MNEKNSAFLDQLQADTISRRALVRDVPGITKTRSIFAPILDFGEQFFAGFRLRGKGQSALRPRNPVSIDT